MLHTLLLRVVAYRVIRVIGRSAARHVPYLFFLILLRKSFRLVSRVALPRATFGGPGRPFFADGTRPSRGAYRIVGGAQPVFTKP